MKEISLVQVVLLTTIYNTEKEKKNNITKEAHQTGYEVEKMPRDQMRPERPYGRVLARTAGAPDNSFRTKKKAKPEKTELKEVKN